MAKQPLEESRSSLREKASILHEQVGRLEEILCDILGLGLKEGDAKVGPEGALAIVEGQLDGLCYRLKGACNLADEIRERVGS